MNAHLKTIVIWLVVIAAVVIGYQIFSTAGGQRKPLKQSEFYEYIEQDQVEVSGGSCACTAGPSSIAAVVPAAARPEEKALRILFLLDFISATSTTSDRTDDLNRAPGHDNSGNYRRPH